MPKTTFEIIRTHWEFGHIEKCSIYELRCDDSKENDVLWWSQSEIEELRKEMRELFILTDFVSSKDLHNMLERIDFVFAKFMKNKGDLNDGN